MEVSLLEDKSHERLNVEVWMWNDDYCEVKTGQTVESIEHTRREGSQFVVMQSSNGRLLKEGCLWGERKKKRRQIVESIEHIRIEGGDGV